MTTTNTASKTTYVSALTSAIDFLSASNFDSEVIEKLTALRSQHEKQAHAPKKPTAKQNENEVLKQAILPIFYDGAKRTAAEVKESCSAVSTLSTQRVTALLTQMVAADLLDREEVKRKTYYFIKVEDVIEE